MERWSRSDSKPTTFGHTLAHRSVINDRHDNLLAMQMQLWQFIHQFREIFHRRGNRWAIPNWQTAHISGNIVVNGNANLEFRGSEDNNMISDQFGLSGRTIDKCSNASPFILTLDEHKFPAWNFHSELKTIYNRRSVSLCWEHFQYKVRKKWRQL